MLMHRNRQTHINILILYINASLPPTCTHAIAMSRKLSYVLDFPEKKINSWGFQKLWKQSWLLLSHHPAEVLLNPRSPLHDTTNPSRPEIQSCLCVTGEVPWRIACKHPTMFHQAFFSLCQSRRLKTSIQRLTLGMTLCSIIQWLLLQSCGEHSSVTDEHP